MKNDSDPNRKKFKAVLITPPAHGKLVFRPNGYFRYKPEANFNGVDSFTYRTTNGSLNSNIAVVTLNVLARNDRPVAKSDLYSVEMNMDLSIEAPGILINDYDVDNDPLTIQLRRKPYHGALTLNPDGSFLYTPKRNYVGADSFTYLIKDGTAASLTMAVKIKVIRPTYTFSGFFAPLSSPQTFNLVAAGSNIPVRFQLEGDRGLVISPNNSPSSVAIRCSNTAPVAVVGETTTDPAGLTYNSAHDQYTYIWATNPNWAGACRKLIYKLNNGSTHTALFKFE